jgi:ABC-type cobalt transport system substrate-binding protein
MKLGVKSMDSGSKTKKCLFLCLAMLLLSLSLHPLAFSSEGKWPGVDESVIEKYAKEHGREPKQPLINTDQGDLLLFVFFFAGAAGGFVAGYYWRTLTIEKAPKSTRRSKKQSDLA